MSIRQAVLTDLNTVKNISELTISEIYPHYYPKGAVDFFLEHHSEENILDDIKKNRVFLCLDTSQNIIGTITVKGNEICRLFVLPDYQSKGFGTEVETQTHSDGTFTACVSVELSPAFYGCVFQFAGKMRILSPEKAVDEYKKMKAAN